MAKEKKAFQSESDKSDSKDALSPLLQVKGALRAEYRKRQRPNVFLNVHPADEQMHIDQGWEVDRRGKKRVRLKRLKSFLRCCLYFFQHLLLLC